MEDKTKLYNKAIDSLKSFIQHYNSNVKLSKQAILSSFISILVNNLSKSQEYNFVGFYMVASKNKEEVSKNSMYVLKENRILEIGPYMSDIIATPIIEYGKGVVGTCWEKEETVIVSNVKLCKNYIACDDVTKSEICLPLKYKDEVIGVLDIDSTRENNFDDVDKKYLLELLSIIEEL